MADARKGHILSSALGAGVHYPLAGTNPPPQCDRPVKRRSLSHSRRASSKTARKSLQTPSLPHHRALQKQIAETPVRGSLLPSTPRSGQNRQHSFGPAGEASTETSYEVVLSIAIQVPWATGTDNSMEATPIRRSASSPMLSTPIQKGLGQGQQPRETRKNYRRTSPELPPYRKYLKNPLCCNRNLNISNNLFLKLQLKLRLETFL